MSAENHLLRLLEPAVRPAGAPAPRVQPRTPVEKGTFQQLLEGQQRPLKLSAHAAQRLEQRGMQLTEPQMAALEAAAERAEAKGARETLMIMDRMGLIVNIPNRTVVTALAEDRMQSGVVTQIDSAVIVDAPTSEVEPASPWDKLK